MHTFCCAIISILYISSFQLALNSQLADSNRHLEDAQRCKDEVLQRAEGRMRELEEELSGERERSSTMEEDLNALKEKRDKVAVILFNRSSFSTVAGDEWWGGGGGREEMVESPLSI